ncbi:acetolactate decarboxylase [Novipirellula artificiosorum]|uniref:Alpha-acetolactate decarboxylase n=1 Tax=Novipirellula artificiosorum TaxID=2528016 RepID=A0A5C6DAS1_9BACT|nr:acetolactate decarboxylase [Novipirellula artificiosorum]TWU31959.1 Alpha-acetolactate decarboxylase precursor [Novipirellula artificiosorum]
MPLLNQSTKWLICVSLGVASCFAAPRVFAQEKSVVKMDDAAANLRADRTETYYQYSIWGAFVNRVFEGFLPVEELKQQGDIGLGSFTKLDGEMVMLDGVPYKIDETGKVFVPPNDEKLVYANAAYFDEDQSFQLPAVSNFEMLRGIIGDRLPSRNYFYAFKVTGNFKSMKCGGLSRQEPPFKEGLDVLIPARPVFDRENFKGTMVGFFCPSFIGDINVAGFHFHFISDDKQFGGHVLEFDATDVTVAFDQMDEYKFALPNSEAYEQVSFEKSFQYKQK